MQSFEIEIFFEKGLFSNYMLIFYRTGWCGKKNRFLRFGASSKGIRLLATSYLKQVGRLNVAAIRIVAD